MFFPSPRTGMMAAALAVGLLLAACGGGETAPPSSSESDPGGTQELTAAQLNAMIPTRRDLDMPLWGVMSPAERVGGPMDNRRAARETGLWNVSREDFDAAGRLGGYVEYYWDGSCGGSCLERPLITLRTEAHVFADSGTASRFLQASASGFQAANGGPGRLCARVAVSEFEPEAFGDDVVGLRTEVGKCANLTGYTWRSTIFLFQVDQVVCLADATSLNDEYPIARALAAAEVVERRVEAVLSGTS